MTTVLKSVALVSCVVLVVGDRAPAIELTGTVRDVCGPVLPGTAVSVVNQSGAVARVAANGEGYYSLSALGPGQWTITFELSGFQTLQQDIRLPQNGDAVQLSVRLLPDLLMKQELIVPHGDPNVRDRKYSVHGVVAGRGGEPISGATVRLRDVGSRTSRATTTPCTTDELGRYVLVAWSPTVTRWRLSSRGRGFSLLHATGFRPGTRRAASHQSSSGKAMSSGFDRTCVVQSALCAPRHARIRRARRG